MILIVVVPILLVLLVIRSARVRSQEKQQLLNEQAQGILGSGFGGTTAGPCLANENVGPVFFLFCLRLGRFVLLLLFACFVFSWYLFGFWHLPNRLGLGFLGYAPLCLWWNRDMWHYCGRALRLGPIGAAF